MDGIKSPVNITVPIEFQRVKKPDFVPFGTAKSGTVISLSDSSVKFSVQSFMSGSLTHGSLLTMKLSQFTNITQLIAEVLKIETDKKMPSRKIVTCHFMEKSPELLEAAISYKNRWQDLYQTKKNRDKEA